MGASSTTGSESLLTSVKFAKEILNKIIDTIPNKDEEEKLMDEYLTLRVRETKAILVIRNDLKV